MDGIKHLIQCKCILPQYKTQQIFHKFVVFSVINDGVVQEKLSQCNNCGAIHKVTELCTSTVISGKDSLSGIMTIDDYKVNLPNNVVNLLEKNNCELYVWEEINFIIKNKKWKSRVLLTHDVYDDYSCGKYMIVKSKNNFEIQTFNEQTVTNT